MEELLDIYDGTGKSLGFSKPKSEVHLNGFWHKSFHCWILNKNHLDEDCILLQKRSSNKKSWPDKYDISAAGHYTSGEGIEGGLREIKEELGVNISQENLIPLGIRVCIEEFDPKAKNHEFQDIFFLEENRKLEDYKMALNEVSGLVSIPILKGIQLFAGQIPVINAQGYILNENGIVEKREFNITINDFIPTLDNYYFKILILANRFLKGENLLLI